MINIYWFITATICPGPFLLTLEPTVLLASWVTFLDRFLAKDICSSAGLLLYSCGDLDFVSPLLAPLKTSLRTCVYSLAPWRISTLLVSCYREVSSIYQNQGWDFFVCSCMYHCSSTNWRSILRRRVATRGELLELAEGDQLEQSVLQHLSLRDVQKSRHRCCVPGGGWLTSSVVFKW